MSASAVPPAPALPTASFWQRRVVTPIVNQLKQGITPEKIALTIALGLMLSVFPIVGATTILCAVAAIALRLNQPIIQLINYFAYPLQIALLIPFYRAGERLLGLAPVPLNVPLLIEHFRADAGRFFKDFGLIAVGGVLAWLIVAPLVVAVLYFTARPFLRALAVRVRAPLAAESPGR